MKAQRFIIVLLLCLVALAPLSARQRKTQTITAEQAKNHIGETARVCGLVASLHFAFKTRGQPPFLNLGKPYPHQVFTAVSWGLDRGKFGDPEQHYLNRRVCVTGPITVYHGQPEMILKDPKQVETR